MIEILSPTSHEGPIEPRCVLILNPSKQRLALQEHFLPYFAAAGYDSYAVSLRGQGESQRLPGMKASSLAQHVADLSSIVAALPRPAVLIGHSFGGLVVQR